MASSYDSGCMTTCAVSGFDSENILVALQLVARRYSLHAITRRLKSLIRAWNIPPQLPLSLLSFGFSRLEIVPSDKDVHRYAEAGREAT